MVSLVSLIFLEMILSIDNLIFISLVTSTLPPSIRELAKFIGLGAALLIRLGLLFFLNTLTNLNHSLIKLPFIDLTIKEFIFIAGGIFLVFKSIKEIRKIVWANDIHNLEERKPKFIKGEEGFVGQFIKAIAEIIFVDFVFSLDSIIVAIALVGDIKTITIAMIVSCLSLFISINFISGILDKRPSLKLLATSFVCMIGIFFILDGFELHFDRGYLNSALLFALIFEILDIIRGDNNMLVQNKTKVQD